MNEAAQRAEIKQYVHQAFLAKIMHLNEIRHNKKRELREQRAFHGHSVNSSACLIGEFEIEEDCIARLLHEKADLYIDAYDRKGLKIGSEVLNDISHSQVEMTATRKSTLIAEAQLTATRTNQPQGMTPYGHLGKKASIAMMEVRAKIELYNLTPKKADPVTITNISHHLSGIGNRVVHGDDNSVNVINEKELFDQLAALVTTSIANTSERQELLDKLDGLKHEPSKMEYLAKMTQFMSSAISIAHVIAPYLPALIDKATALL